MSALAGPRPVPPDPLPLPLLVVLLPTLLVVLLVVPRQQQLWKMGVMVKVETEVEEVGRMAWRHCTG